jgi:hypothetical protein
MAYEPAWLSGEEIYRRLGGIEKARPWLKRAILDRGIVADRAAYPAHDLFRLPHPIRWHAGRRWRPNANTIDWNTLEIRAPHPSRRLWRMTPIEVSAKLLPSPTMPPNNQRYSGDDPLVDEAISGIIAGEWASAHDAAKALALRAKGQSEAANIDRLGRKIRDWLRR